MKINFPLRTCDFTLKGAFSLLPPDGGLAARLNAHSRSCFSADDSSSALEDAEDALGSIPYIPTAASRLQRDFTILKWLGKGGFGDVIKVTFALTLNT